MILALLAIEQVIADRFQHKSFYTNFNGKNFHTKIYVKKIQKNRKVSLYKRLPIPGTSKYVTVKSGDLYKSVDIFYDHRKFNIRTADIMKMKTVPDIIRTLKVYKIG